MEAAIEPGGGQTPTNQKSVIPRSADQAIKPGTRRVAIPLKEGDAVLAFPEPLSSDSVEDLDAHLALFIRSLRREYGMPFKLIISMTDATSRQEFGFATQEDLIEFAAMKLDKLPQNADVFAQWNGLAWLGRTQLEKWSEAWKKGLSYAGLPSRPR